MKIEILVNGITDTATGNKLVKGDVIEVNEQRGKAAIKDGRAKEVKEENKAIEPKTEKKDCAIAETSKKAKSKKK